MQGLTSPQPDNFSNGPWPGGVPPDTGRPTPVPEVRLRRVFAPRRTWWGAARESEAFELLVPIRYAATLGDRKVTVTVPQASGRFATDLASVPPWFTWLVPKSGEHLPAALVHDGLVPDSAEPEQTYETSDGEPVDRIDADAIFRDAMRDSHVRVVRRWLVWAAVTTVSLYRGPRREWPWPHRLYFWGVMTATFLAILYLGAAATFDLADRVPSWLDDWPWLGALPWMPEERWWWELVTGASGAVVVPLGLSLAWLRHWRAGAVAGTALATLVHVTAAVALVAALYWLGELVLGGERRGPVALAASVLAALAVFLVALI